MSKSRRLSFLSIFSALIIMQSYIPMFGYIRLFPMWPAIATTHLTVALGALVLGKKGGAQLGLLWGLISLIRAYTEVNDPVTLLLFRNPVIALTPRILAGFVAGAVMSYGLSRAKRPVSQLVWMGLGGLSVALTNTLGVIGLTWLFFASNATAIVPGATAMNLGWLLISALAINAVAEIALAVGLVPLIGRLLVRLVRPGK